jgi:hypothetical protein
MPVACLPLVECVALPGLIKGRAALGKRKTGHVALTAFRKLQEKSATVDMVK